MAVLLFPAAFMARAETTPANIWASVQFNKRSVVVGEPLIVTVTVYTSTWFTAPPEFSEIQVPEAMMVDYQQRTGAKQKTIGNKSYPAIEKKFVVYPFRVGENSLPQLTIVVESPPEGDYKGKRRVIKSPERTFTVKPPPEGLNMEKWLTAYNVQLFERWDKPMDQLMQGDVCKRRITIQAYGALAALIPPLELEGGGYGNVYSQPASLNNVQNQASFTGTRIESWTYLMESEGTYTIPGIKVSWYDPGSGKVESVAIEAREISIAENPNLDFLLTMQDSLQALLETGEEIEKEPFEWMGLNWWQLVVAGLSGLIIIYLVIRMIRRIVSSVRRRKVAAIESEEHYFEELVKVSREGDPSKVMKALIGWYDRYRSERFGPGFENFICVAGAADLKNSFAQLERIVFAGEEQDDWNGKSMMELVREARKKVTNRYKPTPELELIELNPGNAETETCKTHI
ncbi:MAG: BatD family protein [Bacteroidota bacterium]